MALISDGDTIDDETTIQCDFGRGSKLVSHGERREQIQDNLLAGNKRDY